MSTITTLDGLASQAVGTTIRVNRDEYVTAADGLTRNVNGVSVTVPFAEFSGSVAAGTVTAGPIYEVGQVYGNSGGLNFRILSIEEPEAGERAWARVVVYNSTSGEYSHLGRHRCRDIGATGRVADLTSEAHRRAEAWSRGMVEQQQRITALESERTVLENRVEAMRVEAASRPAAHTLDPAFIRAMHEALDGDEIDRDSAMDDVLREYGHERVGAETEINVDVMIEGTTTLSLAASEELVNSSRVVDLADGVEITWSHRATIEVSGREGSCVCGDVDRDLVRSWLDDEDISYSDFDYEVEDCEVCQ